MIYREFPWRGEQGDRDIKKHKRDIKKSKIRKNHWQHQKKQNDIKKNNTTSKQTKKALKKA
jgi:hypothetical protein